MTKIMNSAGRKNRKRMGALKRLEAKIYTKTGKLRKKLPENANRIRAEIAVLKSRIMDQDAARAVRTKKLVANGRAPRKRS